MSLKKKKPPSSSDNSKKPIKENMKNSDFFIIGIGASAGGLETLKAFFSTMPRNSNMAFVIIQHLSPKHKSIMVSLLEKHTQMTVQQIKDGIKIKPNHIFLNPPGKNVSIFNGSLHLIETVKTSAINMPIDFFFRSLSEDMGEKSVGIILSGTASDGTLGIKAIKAENGMVMVQQPDTALYDGMPKSAVETGVVDFILPVELMPDALIKYATHPFLESQGKIKLSDTKTKNQMNKIFALIRGTTGHDFSYYKPTTISRRIERRMDRHQIKKLSDYFLYLQKNNSEIEELFNNLVIGVTSFFRDPKAYTLLEQKVLSDLMKTKPSDSMIRIWVAGCSTGEEAYSLAIIISELMEKIKKYFNVQIFATDIDSRAIDTARRGIYSQDIRADISQERIDKYFIKEPDGLQIKKPIRDMVVFSIQNLIKDPPFSRLDLVSCRNLMIYMDNVLQEKIIPLFHYTLNPEGILFLGTSESIGKYTDLFKPFNSKWKIFKRCPSLNVEQTHYRDDFGPHALQKITGNKKENITPENDLQGLVERVVIDNYAPAGILINDKYEVLHFIGKTEKYLVPPKGKPSFNVLELVRQDLKNNLMVTIHKAVRENKAKFCDGVKIKCHDDFCIVNISVKPMTDKDNLAGLWLVMFEDKTVPEGSLDKKSKPGKSSKKDADLQNLKMELQSTREYLQSTIEELETSNEELKSTNEELQSVNEEMQSTNEELETSKEELQSTNEELSTVNTELTNKMDDYSNASNDMNNLLAATQIATMFIDMNLCIKNFTPATMEIINLIQTDIGRPLNDLKVNFDDVDFTILAEKVLKDLNTLEMNILSKNNVWYALKIIPYRTLENIIDGVVLTFVNVDKIKRVNEYKRLATVLMDSNDAVTVQDIKGNINAWNKGAQRMYGWTESEALKMNINQLFPEDKSNELKLVIEKLKKGETIKPFTTRRKTKNGEMVNVWLTITALVDENKQPIEFASTERDLAWLADK